MTQIVKSYPMNLRPKASPKKAQIQIETDTIP